MNKKASLETKSLRELKKLKKKERDLIIGERRKAYSRDGDRRRSKRISNYYESIVGKTMEQIKDIALVDLQISAGVIIQDLAGTIPDSWKEHDVGRLNPFKPYLELIWKKARHLSKGLPNIDCILTLELLEVQELHFEVGIPQYAEDLPRKEFVLQYNNRFILLAYAASCLISEFYDENGDITVPVSAQWSTSQWKSLLQLAFTAFLIINDKYLYQKFIPLSSSRPHISHRVANTVLHFFTFHEFGHVVVDYGPRTINGKKYDGLESADQESRADYSAYALLLQSHLSGSNVDRTPLALPLFFKIHEYISKEITKHRENYIPTEKAVNNHSNVQQRLKLIAAMIAKFEETTPGSPPDTQSFLPDTQSFLSAINSINNINNAIQIIFKYLDRKQYHSYRFIKDDLDKMALYFQNLATQQNG